MLCPGCGGSFLKSDIKGSFPRYSCVACSLGFHPAERDDTFAISEGAQICPACGGAFVREQAQLGGKVVESKVCKGCGGLLADLKWFGARADHVGPAGTAFHPVTIAASRAPPPVPWWHSVAEAWRKLVRRYSGRQKVAVVAPPPRLVVIAPEHARREFTLDKRRVSVGRGNTCDARIDLRSVSEHHAMLSEQRGAWSIEHDLRSNVELLVNGKSCSFAFLAPDDVISLGPTVEARFVAKLERWEQRSLLSNSVEAPVFAGAVELEILSGEMRGRPFIVEAPKAMIGRDPKCQINLPDASIAKLNAQLIRERGTCRVVRLPSSNIMTVNGKETRQAYVHPNDVIALGAVKMRVSGATSGVQAMPSL